MKNRGLIVLFVVLFVSVLLSVNIVSAEVSISQPNGLYNVGDEINISANIVVSQDTNGFANFVLQCTNGNVEFYKAPVILKSGQQKTIDLSTYLETFVIGNLSGKCYIEFSYAGNNMQTRNFEISREIIVNLNLNSIVYNPGENVFVSGNAVKKNNQLLNGFAEVFIPSINVRSVVSVIDGKFNSNISLPNDLAAGNQEIIVRAYEKDSGGNLLNEGSASSSIKISQVPKSLRVALNRESFMPGDEVTYTLIVYDQSGKEMSVNVNANIASPNKVSIDKIVDSSVANSFVTESNAMPGAWTITGSYVGLSISKAFNIEISEKIKSELVNVTLIITNIGNVIYQKSIEIKIGDVSEMRQLNLGIGESKKFRLGAPDGKYDIQVGDGESNDKLGSVFLTGKAVSISDEQRKGLIVSGITWAWVFIIIILGVIAVIYYKKFSKPNYTPNVSAKKADYYVVSSSQNNNVKQSNNIEHGKKEKVGVVSLKIRNMKDLNNRDSSAREIMKRVFDDARGVRGKVVQSGDSFSIIFAPVMTKEAENSLRAVKLANLIKQEFDEHNRKYAQKISYGVGVHEGEMIVELSQGNLKFNPLGNALSYSKKMADSAQNEVYISNPVHSFTRAKVKVERSKNGIYWKVSNIPDSEKHSEFLKKFMDRQ